MSEAKGFLAIEIKSPPIIAGTVTTVNMIIRNPFSEQVIIESIQAPSSAPLLPLLSPTDDQSKQENFFYKLLAPLSSLQFKEIRFGPLTAEFPNLPGRHIHINMEPKSRLILKTPFEPNDNIHINQAEEAEVIVSMPDKSTSSSEIKSERIIHPQQEDLASFELKTAHWLLVKPKVLDLYALVKFRVGDQSHSQVVPVSLSIQPPVRSMMLGSISGGLLGWLAKQLNDVTHVTNFLTSSSIVSLLGVIVMAMILAIVLSRQESSKGFVTLEDFYGAFVVGVLLGYTGTQYFESTINAVAKG